MNSLRNCFDKHNCDKGRKHQYERCYEPHFESKREEAINILEIGCFLGESTAAFLEYFPNATIYTIDIFDRHPPEDVAVLKEERVKWMKYDSMSAGLPSKIRSEWGGDIEFDFIIDDGAHWPEANRLTFENCFQFLKKDGTYFIEDVWMLDKMKGTHYWIARKPQRYNILEHSRLMSSVEKYEVKHYDYRKEKESDTYILAIQANKDD